MIATIASIRSLSPRVKEFVLRLSESVSFAAGQFVVLSAEVQGEMFQRSYSIANERDGDTQEVRLCVALNEAGKVTPWLFQQCEGAMLDISEPQGGFVLRPTSAEVDVVFVCTGTGVAPFRSMIQSCLTLNPNRKVHLVFGNRTEADVLYHEQWQELANTVTQFFYHPVISRPDANLEPLLFHHGYVHEVYKPLIQENPNTHVYVCGWEVMCTEARQQLKGMGLTRRQYFFEQYDG
ncbi:MAG: FAD-dependent oxidoreductase [Bacteroidia bacterium]|nr:FAD-dependent oxidoreductase [Bacteroidia bacterium]